MVKIHRRNKNILIYKWFGALCMVLFSVMIIKGVIQQPQIAENEKQIKMLQEKIEYEKNRIEEVEALKDKVDTDEYIEKVAREKLGMIRRDEIVFIDVSGQ